MNHQVHFKLYIGCLDNKTKIVFLIVSNRNHKISILMSHFSSPVHWVLIYMWTREIRWLLSQTLWCLNWIIYSWVNVNKSLAEDGIIAKLYLYNMLRSLNKHEIRSPLIEFTEDASWKPRGLSIFIIVIQSHFIIREPSIVKQMTIDLIKHLHLIRFLR